MTKVTTTLNPCAIRKAYKGRLFPELKRSEKRVSNPILVKANTNHNVWMLVKLSFTLLTASWESKNEKMSEAATKPSTNFGNLSQINLSVGFSTAFPDVFLFVYVQ